MGRPQFSRQREAWGWDQSLRKLVGAIIPTVAFAVVLWNSYGLMYVPFAILALLLVVIAKVLLNRRVMKS